MYPKPYIDGGNLFIPIGNVYVGFQLWSVCAAVALAVGLMIVGAVLLAAMSSKRLDKNSGWPETRRLD